MDYDDDYDDSHDDDDDGLMTVNIDMVMVMMATYHCRKHLEAVKERMRRKKIHSPPSLSW